MLLLRSLVKRPRHNLDRQCLPPNVNRQTASDLAERRRHEAQSDADTKRGREAATGDNADVGAVVANRMSVSHDAAIQRPQANESSLHAPLLDANERLAPEEVRAVLGDEVAKVLLPMARPLELDAAKRPHVILVVGVNGSGKTTTIAKLAKVFRDGGKKVLLAAADTFRAAAAEQLEIWAKRARVEIVRGQAGGDPAAVAFDACKAAMARGVDIVIVDTAGRLHTKTKLMEELKKIHRVLGKAIAHSPHEVLLVLDATTGQNAIIQAKEFKQTVDVTGVVVTKLDGTAKGGVVVAIRKQVGLPVKYIGIGEQPQDIALFVPDDFVDALFADMLSADAT